MNQIVFCIIMVTIVGIGSAQFVPGNVADPTSPNSPFNPFYHHNDNDSQPGNNDKQIGGSGQGQSNCTPKEIPNREKCVNVTKSADTNPPLWTIPIIVIGIFVIIYILGMIIKLPEV